MVVQPCRLTNSTASRSAVEASRSALPAQAQSRQEIGPRDGNGKSPRCSRALSRIRVTSVRPTRRTRPDDPSLRRSWRLPRSRVRRGQQFPVRADTGLRVVVARVAGPPEGRGVVLADHRCDMCALPPDCLRYVSRPGHARRRSADEHAADQLSGQADRGDGRSTCLLLKLCRTTLARTRSLSVRTSWPFSC